MRKITLNAVLFLLAVLILSIYTQPKQVDALSTVLPPTFVNDINPGIEGSYPKFITEYKGKYFFVANHAVLGKDLWSSDLSEAGTKIVKDLADEPNPTYAAPLLVFKEKLYFKSNSSIWVTDGTADGTTKLKDFGAGADIRQMAAGSSIMFILTKKQDPSTFAKIFELYASDGTEAGTILLRQVTIDPGVYVDGIGSVTIIGDVAYFSSYETPYYGNEPWRSDGTVAGTYRVKNIVGNPGNTEPSEKFTELNGSVYFIAGDASIYKTTGELNNATLVVDYPVRDLVSYKGSIYYIAETGGTTNGWKLYKSDGNVGYGQLVKQINAGSSSPYFQKVNDLIIFIDVGSDWNLWRSDGTETGTFLLKTFTGTDTLYDGIVFDSFDNTPYFAVRTGHPDSTYTYSIWTTDGTSNGTTPLFSLPYGALTDVSAQFTVLNKRMVFSGMDTEHGRELWVYEMAQITPIFVPMITR